MGVQIIYYNMFWCRMWRYRYFRRYWLGNSSTYPIYRSDFGTISLLYLCMNVLVLLLYFISVLHSWFSDCCCCPSSRYLHDLLTIKRTNCFINPHSQMDMFTKSLPVTNKISMSMSPAYLHRSVYKSLSLVPMTEMD